MRGRRRPGDTSAAGNVGVPPGRDDDFFLLLTEGILAAARRGGSGVMDKFSVVMIVGVFEVVCRDVEE